MSLQNRFSDDVFIEWMYIYTCQECGENKGDALHHIISPSNKHFIKGEHNTSVYNSILLCNDKCHLYNSELHKEYKTREYLRKTLEIMTHNGYIPTEKDELFFNNYLNLYNNEKQ